MKSRLCFILIGVFSSALILLVLAWLSRGLLKMEAEQAVAQQQRRFDEDLRLTLWQLDSAGMAVLVNGGASLEGESVVLEESSGSYQDEEGSVNPLAYDAGVGLELPNDLDAPERRLSSDAVSAEAALGIHDKVGKNEGELREGQAVQEQIGARGKGSAASAPPLQSVSKPKSKNRLRQEIESQIATNVERQNKAIVKQSSKKGLESKKRSKKEQSEAPKDDGWSVRSTIFGADNSFANKGYAQPQVPGEALEDQGSSLDAGDGSEETDVVQVNEIFEAAVVDDDVYLTKALPTGERIGKKVSVDVLSSHLLGQISTPFGGAKQLIASPANSMSDPFAMVTLPFRFVVDAPSYSQVEGITPLRGALLLGWSAILLGGAAICALVIGLWRLSERRAAFVSAVTHELRTPLTTFQLYSDLLSEGMVDEKKTNIYLQTMRAEAGRLSRLVENVLAYAKIERGTAKQRFEQLSVERLIDRIVPHLEQRLQQAEGILLVKIDETVCNKTQSFDVTAIEQVLFNLVDNASKYALPRASDRTVELDVFLRGKQLCLKVSDRGAGVVDSERGKLFTAFRRSAKDAAEAGAPGVGLGLALCRRIARRLKGDLQYEDGNPGSVFLLTIPWKSIGSD